VFSTKTNVTTMIHNSDWSYAAITIPWLSQDPVNVVLSGGQGFGNVFDDERPLNPDAGDRIDMIGWEFVGLWQAAFPGLNMIAWLVFRKREASRVGPDQIRLPA
jgi:hypothetical protein